MADSSQHDLSQHDQDHLNQVAELLTGLYGYLPLNVRYQAAASALAVVYDWIQPTWKVTPAEYVAGMAELKDQGAMAKRKHPPVFTPNWVTCPGETLAEWFAWSHLPHTIANLYGISAETLSGILAGDTPITDDLACRLMNLTHVGAPFWLAMEHNYRVGLAAGLTHPHGKAG